MNHLDLFSGIGGFALAVDTIWHEEKNEHIFVENDTFCIAVLKKHWPNAEYHGDIREFVADTEHNGLTEPENDGLVLQTVCTDLEKEGYEVQPFIIPACAVGAPHRRDRVWIVANRASGKSRESSKQKGREDTGRGNSHAQNPISERRGRGMESNGQVLERQNTETQNARPSWEENWLEVATRLCALDDGLPNGLSRPRGWRNAALKAAGNAIVPAIAIELMSMVKLVDEGMQ